MSTRLEIWAQEVAFLHSALCLREKTLDDAAKLALERMRIEDLFRRRRLLDEQETELSARLRALWLDIEEILLALLAKLDLLHERREYFLQARDALRRWKKNPSRVLSGAADFHRFMELLAEVSGHPECEEILYELQELQLEIESAEHEIMDIRLRREELRLDAEEQERRLQACMNEVHLHLSTLFFGRPKALAAFFLNGKKPDPKARNLL